MLHALYRNVYRLLANQAWRKKEDRMRYNLYKQSGDIKYAMLQSAIGNSFKVHFVFFQMEVSIHVHAYLLFLSIFLKRTVNSNRFTSVTGIFTSFFLNL